MAEATAGSLGRRTAALTAAAMVAFAANSVLARLALDDDAVDPSSYTSVRLASGAVVLVGVLALQSSGVRQGFREALRLGTGRSAFWLFAYAAAFSFAYVSLGAATGALILFGVVQATLMTAALVRGERPGPLFWVGFVASLAGLAYLVAPGLSAPDPVGALLMAAAGLAWGCYTLRGQRAVDPVGATAGNFVLSLPFVAVLLVATVAMADLTITPRGLLLAVVSGAVTSGLGYVIWYAALPGLSGAQAAVVQLTVAPLTALAAVLVLDEVVTVRMAVSTVLILGGVALAIRARMPRSTGTGRIEREAQHVLSDGDEAADGDR